MNWAQRSSHEKPAACRVLFATLGVAVVLLGSSCGTADQTVESLSQATATSFTALPVREGPRTETTHAVPHVQTSAALVVDVDAELRRRIYSLPGVENRDTIVSFTGTKALWMSTTAEPSTLAATLRDREFAHIHPDGSLHVVLPVDRALEATAAKWAELHPWVGRDDFWDGMVMLYTPQSFEELDVIWQLVVDSYNLATAQNVDAGDFS